MLSWNKPPDPTTICQKKIDATPTGVRNGLALIRTILKRHRLQQDDLGSVELVLAEVMNNVVEHAYIARNDGVIAIDIRACGSGLAIQVRDTGRPIPDLTLPSGMPANLDVDTNDLPEGSFGWGMIRHLAEGLHYARVRKQNRLSFRIPLTHPPDPP